MLPAFFVSCQDEATLRSSARNVLERLNTFSTRVLQLHLRFSRASIFWHQLKRNCHAIRKATTLSDSMHEVHFVAIDETYWSASYQLTSGLFSPGEKIVVGAVNSLARKGKKSACLKAFSASCLSGEVPRDTTCAKLGECETAGPLAHFLHQPLVLANSGAQLTGP